MFIINTQTLLKECKYEIKKTEMENLTDDELEASSSNDDDEKESDDEKDNNESNE